MLFKTFSIEYLLYSALLVGLFGCKQEDKDIEIKKDPTISTFYLIRHAEKDQIEGGHPDPELSQAGLGRAIYWAEVFDPVPLDAIYSTNFERTTMTAAPTSVKKNIDIDFYNPENMDITAFKADNLGKQVLVVGHGDTVPELANKLIGEPIYPEMAEGDNATYYIVRFLDDQVTHFQLKMN